MAGNRHPGCATSAADLGRLATILDVDRTLLEAISYRPAERFAHNRFRSGCLHREMIDISFRRACPACLGEQDHHRTAWDLALLTCCPSHGIRLLSRCHRCGRKLGWTDPDVGTCRCGADLRQPPTTAVTDAEQSAGDKLLSITADEAGEWLPMALRPCDAADLVRLAMCLGMFFTGWTRERRVETLCSEGPDTVAKVMVAGLEGLTRWPSPLLAFLSEERVKASTRGGRFGARKQLGPFYGWMRDLDPSPLRDVLVDVVRQDADPVLVRRSHRSRLLNPATITDGAVGLVEAARILGCSQATAKRILTGRELEGGSIEGRGVPMVVKRSLVEQLARENTAVLNLEQVAAALCVSQAGAREMVDGGLLPVLHRPGKGGRARWAIPASGVQDLLSRCEARCHPLAAKRLISFRSTMEALRRVDVGVPELVRMLLDGRLTPNRLDEAARGMDRLLFDPILVRRLCRDLDGATTVTIQVAAERLGLKWQVMAHLIRQGIVKGSEQGIDFLEVERFRTIYVSGAELAREMGTSPRAAARHLAERGIIPASGPGVDGGRQNFFVRSAQI